MYFSSGSVRIRCVSAEKLMGRSVKHLAIEQLATGCSRFGTHAARVMSGDKVSVRLSMRT